MYRDFGKMESVSQKSRLETAYFVINDFVCSRLILSVDQKIALR